MQPEAEIRKIEIQQDRLRDEHRRSLTQQAIELQDEQRKSLKSEYLG